MDTLLTMDDVDALTREVAQSYLGTSIAAVSNQPAVDAYGDEVIDTLVVIKEGEEDRVRGAVTLSFMVAVNEALQRRGT